MVRKVNKDELESSFTDHTMSFMKKGTCRIQNLRLVCCLELQIYLGKPLGHML